VRSASLLVPSRESIASSLMRLSVLATRFEVAVLGVGERLRVGDVVLGRIGTLELGVEAHADGQAAGIVVGVHDA
jgi:hypothetical protein